MQVTNTTQSLSGFAILRAHDSVVRAISFNSDGQYLVSGDDNGFCCLWSLETRRPVAIWKAHENAMLTCLFIPKSDANPLILTHARDNKLRIWRNPLDCNLDFFTKPLNNNNTAEYPKPWLLYTQDINALNFCSVAVNFNKNMNIQAGEMISYAAPATVSSETIDIYSLDENFQVSRPFKGLDASEFMPLEQQLDDEEHQQQKRGKLGTVMSLIFYEKLLVAGYESGHVVSFDLENNAEVKCFAHPHNSPILSLAFNLSKNSVLASAANKTIYEVDLLTSECKQVAKLQHRGVASIDLCEELGLAVTAGWDGEVRLFSVLNNSFTELQALKGSVNGGITQAKIAKYSPCTNRQRRLREPPMAWIASAGKNGRIGIYAIYNPK